MGDKKKPCPRCGAKGTGPYARWVLNSRKQRYEPYLYFAHKARGKIDWCYLGKPSGKQLSNLEGKSCRRCSHLTTLDNRAFCRLLQSFLMPETFSQPCDGFERSNRR